MATTIQTGVGRPANPEWVSEFKEVFRHSAPAVARLAMRKIPGVTDISGQEFSRRSGLYNPGEADEARLAAQIRETIGYLCSRGELDETTARQSIRPVGRARFNLRPQNGAQKLSAIFPDIASDIYPEGYLLEGERPVIRGAWGIPEDWDKNRATRAHPLVHVGICMIENLPQPAIKEVLAQSCEHLRDTLELMPLDIVRLEF